MKVKREVQIERKAGKKERRKEKFYKHEERTEGRKKEMAVGRKEEK